MVCRDLGLSQERPLYVRLRDQGKDLLSACELGWIIGEHLATRG